MARHQANLLSAIDLLKSYNGEMPFAAFLKEHFRLHPKYGSRDRKNISRLCYGYFRWGRALDERPAEDIMLAGLFLITNEPEPLLAHLRPQWVEKVHLSTIHKLDLLQAKDKARSIFPYLQRISDRVHKEDFSISHLVQPDLFLRIRPGKKAAVKHKLEEARIVYNLCSDDCIALPNGTKADSVININEEAVIQDRQSQRVIELLKEVLPSNAGIRAWDCCAASGGKTILLHDHFPGATISVSDVRSSILINLKKRLAQAGIKKYNSFVADLAAKDFRVPGKFDLVLCDAPCSGSGTWGRTPEQLRFFREEQIVHYTRLQQQILSNIVTAVKTNGYLLYITCSVFTAENEEQVGRLTANQGLELIRDCYYTGYTSKGDTLYAALLKKNS